MGRGLVFLLASVVILGAVLWGRGRFDRLEFIVPEDAGAVLYATTFDDGRFASDWFQVERLGAVSRVTDDALRLSFDDQTPGRERLLSTNQYLFQDFDLRVEAAAVEGPLNNSYGLVFRRLDEQTYYLFYVSSDGYYSVWRETPQQVIKLSDWIASDVVNQGVEGAVNQLRVVANGDTFQFFVNGNALDLCIPDDPAGESTVSGGVCVGGAMQPTLVDDTIPHGAPGVAIETILDGGMSVIFDNVVVLPASSS